MEIIGKIGLCVLGLALGAVAIFSGICTLITMLSLVTWVGGYGTMNTIVALLILVAATAGSGFGAWKAFVAMVEL